MRFIITLSALAASLLTVHAQTSSTAEFKPGPDFTCASGATGWTGTYGSSNFSPTGSADHWAASLTSGHRLSETFTGDFTMQWVAARLAPGNDAIGVIGAIDHSVTTGISSAAGLSFPAVNASTARMDTLRVTPVPEPSTVALVGVGVATLVLAFRPKESR